jgi:DegV family protein with EDD domain
MSTVAVVTDSAANIPDHLVRELGIHVVPLGLVIDGHASRDGVDTTPDEICRRQRVDKFTATTAAPSIGDFLRAYAAAGQEAADVVSVHLSRRLRATQDAALDASRLVDGVRVHVVDSCSGAMGEGFVAVEAARAALAGASPEAVLVRAEDVASRTDLLFTIPTLEYLHRGGRVGVAAVLLAAALQINPVLSLADGQIEPVARPRTRARAVRLVLKEMDRRVGDRPLHAAVFHADVLGEAEALREAIAERFRCAELYVTSMTPVMGAHTGPGILGAAFYVD